MKFKFYGVIFCKYQGKIVKNRMKHYFKTWVKNLNNDGITEHPPANRNNSELNTNFYIFNQRLSKSN